MSKIQSPIIVLLLLSAQLSFGQANQETLVKKSFENYRSAILNDRGEEAVSYVDSRTIKYYNDVLHLVKTADSSKIETLSILDKLMVLSIRHRTAKNDILSFDGKTLLIYAIKSGMVGKNSVMNISIGEVTIDGDFAKGQFVVNGQKSPIPFNFYKEEGQWKIDLTCLFPATTTGFKNMVNGSGQNENVYLFTLLEMMTGKKPGAEIWEPVR